ncbi:PREDICTED: lipoamide acyltransferase component of branched-chain alpha-keto acid dehydrogenase complex, mitochondrial [Tarenaya hassleriana]|uniref:lipoamide acyltransferase component of branched-chain alpha-keto acid dehydrogenase complex, mitochondrial n=1 Tax=Tarenaya hassleriana TaxID=28532 RepID=UPI00053CA34A|nr:PREDICTED: lipoamide acyltransferase component of branched-chain alpha-keto acid dehydrogenase complex, mitochondrial [Tarenaya hassleriana]
MKVTMVARRILRSHRCLRRLGSASAHAPSLRAPEFNAPPPFVSPPSRRGVVTPPALKSWSEGTRTRSWFSSLVLAKASTNGLVDVPLAQTGEGIAECELLKWFVKEGDSVEEFQPLCEVQSDKATIEITSRFKGKVAQISHVPGDIVKVGETLLRLAVEESECCLVTSDSSSANVNSRVCEQPKTESLGGVLSTPAVRNLAKMLGIDINDVLGTGKDRRILKEDVLRYGAQKGIVTDASSDVTDQDCAVSSGESNAEDKTVPLRGFHRAMVKTMTMAAKVPHFYFVEEINCDALVDLKASFQENNTDPDIKHTFLPVLIKSLSMALTKYPTMNSCFNEESIEMILKGSHNIGVAMATQHGLVVPNIKNVQSLSVLQVTKELSRLQHLAKNNKLNPEDITGGTITLSNIGAIGGKFGSPLLNLPEVAIIALGRIQKVPKFSDDGTVYPGSIMTVNVAADHRVLDGATVARFCCEWKRFIEKPELLMLHMR